MKRFFLSCVALLPMVAFGQGFRIGDLAYNNPAPTSSGTPWAFVRSGSTNNSGTTRTDVKVTLASIASGNTLIAYVQDNRATGTGTIASSPLETWVTGPTVTNVNIGSGVILREFHAFNVSSGTHTVTVTLGSGDFHSMHLLEYSSVASADVNAIGTGALGAAGAFATASATTTANGDLISVFGAVLSGPLTPDTGYTQRENNGGISTDKSQTTAGALTGTAVTATDDQYAILMCTFKHN